MKVVRLLALAVLAGFPCVTAGATEPVLKVTTEIGSHSYALSDLDRFDQNEISTRTTWSDVEKKFSGPLVRDVLADSDMPLDAGFVLAKALNGYSVRIPVSEFIEMDVLLATRVDGNRIALEDRGPLRIIYDYSAVGPVKDSFWVWMLDEMVLVAE